MRSGTARLPGLTALAMLLTGAGCGWSEPAPEPDPPAVVDARQLSSAVSLAGPSVAEQPAPEAMRFLPAVHPLAQEMLRRGAIECAPRGQQLMGVLSEGRDVAVLQLPPTEPNRTLLSAMLVYPPDPGRSRVALMAMAPGQVNGCGASFQGIEFFERSCPQTLATDYPDAAFQAIPGGNAYLATGNGTDNILALPAGSGCLVIRQQVVE